MKITSMLDVSILESPKEEIELEILTAETYAVDFPPAAGIKYLTGESLIDYIVENNISLGDIQNNISLI